MDIRPSTIADLGALLSLFAEARATIATLGIDQWQNGYPDRAVIEQDIRLGRSFTVTDGGALCGTFVIVEDGEPTYDCIFEGHWPTGDDSRDYIAVHRVAVSVSRRGRGISTAIMDFARARAAELGRSSVRIDTHRGNVVMQNMLKKHGFLPVGVIYLADGAERIAFERQISKE